jgi:hypothetical protein
VSIVFLNINLLDQGKPIIKMEKAQAYPSRNAYKNFHMVPDDS